MDAKDKILQVADELFGENGFDATTTRQISEKSGVNKALIHYHFKSKQGVLEILLDNYYKRLSGLLLKAVQNAGDFRERLKILAESYFDFLVQNRNFSRIVQREAAGGRHVDRIRTHMVPLFELGRQFAKDNHPFMVSGPLAAEQMMVSIYGMIVSYITYSDLLGELLQSDPMSGENIENRKKHLRTIIDSLMALVDKSDSC